jgi:hypothetical protein
MKLLESLPDRATPVALRKIMVNQIFNLRKYQQQAKDEAIGGAA